MAKKIQLTAEGLKMLQGELETLKTQGRTEIAEKIRVARGYGDLSENSEYDEAKNEQAKIEARIIELEKMLENYELIEESGDTDSVSIGVTVTVFDELRKSEFSYKIVGSAEANPMKGLISDDSPVGRALVGAKVGETVSVEAPVGELKFKIVSITR
ncbi:MAG: transcription elongation factor GreA [Clostridia bacterium]|nr:transcription elongation factor GreA [Clostridia bacterium]